MLKCCFIKVNDSKQRGRISLISLEVAAILNLNLLKPRTLAYRPLAAKKSRSLARMQKREHILKVIALRWSRGLRISVKSNE